MKALIIAAIVSSISMPAMADSCEYITEYAMSFIIKEGGTARIVNEKFNYMKTCQLAVKARNVMSKEEFVSRVINGPNKIYEQYKMFDYADTNNLVARISYDYAR